MRYLPLLLLVLLLPACDDDSSDCGCLPDAEWAEVALPAELVNGGVMKLATDGDRTVALAVSGSGAWVIEESATGWQVVGDQALPGTATPPMSASRIDPSSYASSLALDGAGRVQVAGVALSGPHPLIWSEGGSGWETAQATEVSGYLQDIVPLGSRDVMAAGTGSTGIPYVSGSPGTAFVFAERDLGGEGGLIALDTSPGGTVYGCGFNDAAEGTTGDPFRVVVRYVADEWQLVPSPCLDCGSLDFIAIEAVADGLYVGGSVMVRPAGDPGAPAQESAWLASYLADTEEWAAISLPDAFGLQRVNAILQASSGVVYLACGGFDAPASIVRAVPGEAPEIEWTQDDVRVFDLVETPDGRILACGLEPGDVQGMPILLERGN